ncbi:hypothetical protein L2D14_02215 [Thalassospiraceae bacterium LMO-JJ14]|nr:hypothetical protein L2D14_02215 [Thalassospiraceae bacterium LMO-JJ14]
MEAIENAAFVSVGRAAGFAGLAIFTLMMGLSFDPPLATRTGGLIGMGLVAILVLYGWRAVRHPYRRTEAWLILPKDRRPPEGIAQRIIGRTLRETAYWFAARAAAISSFLLVSSVALKFV